MKKYEFTVILDANEDKTAKGLEFVKAQFAQNNVVVEKEDDMGVRVLAYLIDKQDKGHYFYYEIEAEGDTIAKMSHEFNLNGEVLKYLFVIAKAKKANAADEEAVEEIPAEEAEEAEEEDSQN